LNISHEIATVVKPYLETFLYVCFGFAVQNKQIRKYVMLQFLRGSQRSSCISTSLVLTYFRSDFIGEKMGKIFF